MDLSYKEILRKYWGYTEFRGIQEEIITSIGAGKDTLGLMPTGGGKSITFQVPALTKEGLCLVITPLISLMKDQVDHLRHKGILAAAIYSGMRQAEIVSTLENCIFGKMKFLYVSPERLSSDLFQTKLKRMKVSFITIDEAHCISQWGYDFRPSYLEIANIRKLLPNSPVLALTATATPEVVKDIQAKLNFHEENVFRMSFERKNIAYVIRDTEDKIGEAIHILNMVEGPSILYCRSRRRTKQIADLLLKNNISATFYHAGLDAALKDQHQTDWQTGKIRVMVATNAFGMGIDKPNVRTVIHIDFPSSPEAYFQEAGRAGRDGLKSYAILLHTPKADERKLKKRINDTFPPKDYIAKVYEDIAYFYQMAAGDGYGVRYEFPIDRFCTTFKHYPTLVSSSLQILTRAGYLDYEENPDTKARIKFILDRDELYRLNTSDEKENDVIIALLRNYGGLFIEYCYVDESYIAEAVGLTKNDTYAVLQSLSKKGILDFIPRKNIPFIQYTRPREEGKDIVLTKEVYDDRKAMFEERILAMINYAQNDQICRSRQLLRYFGETAKNDCGQCDVCLAHKKENKTTQDILKEKILALLEDQHHHHITELKAIPTDTSLTNVDVLKEALQELLAEEIVAMEGSYISLNQ